MALTGPTPSVKLYSQLHNRHHLTCTPSNLCTTQRKLLRTQTTAITVNDHSNRNASRNIVNQVSGDRGETRLSEVVDRQPREAYTRPIWKGLDIGIVIWYVALHFLCVFAPFTFSWGGLWLAIGMYAVTLMGITLSYHRHLSHKSFKTPKWLEYTLAYCGVQAFQGDPIYWVRTHRYHHLYCDSQKDPHSPVRGFWFSYINWFFNVNKIPKECGEHNIADDLEKQVFYKFLKNTYAMHPLALALILYAVGGFPFIVWGMGVRTVCLLHVTSLVNTICHGNGQQSWITCDLSRNVWWIGILSFGEGWHNNHHAFQYSAKFGLEWWQVDMAWYAIRLLEIVGLATNVQLPNPTDVQRKTPCFCTSFKGVKPTPD